MSKDSWISQNLEITGGPVHDSAWVSFNPADLLDPEIIVVQEKIEQVAQLAASIVDGARTLIRLLGSVGSLQLDASMSALQIAFGEISKALEDLKDPLGASVLVVPPHPDGGGTRYVANTFSESLADVKDLCRPTFGPDTSYAGFILLVGTNTLKEIMLSFDRLNRTLQLGQPRVPVNLPRPRSLTATPLYLSGKLHRVSLAWDTPRFVPRTSKPKFSVVRSRVYRWDYAGAVVADLNEAKVVYETPHKGSDIPTSAFKPAPRRTMALDSDRPFSDRGHTYVVAYDVEIEEIAGTTETLTTYSGTTTLGAHHVVPDPFVATVAGGACPGGVPPNWKTTRGGVGLALPQITSAADYAQHYLDSWLKSLTTTDDQLQNYVKMLERKAQRRVDQAETISRFVRRAADAVVALSKLGGGYYVFTGNTGSVDDFETLVRRALLGSDPNKPQVDDPHAYATAIVSVVHAAAPDINFKRAEEQLLSLWENHTTAHNSELRNACYQASSAAREISESLDAVLTYDDDLKERYDDAARSRQILKTRGPESS